MTVSSPSPQRVVGDNLMKLRIGPTGFYVEGAQGIPIPLDLYVAPNGNIVAKRANQDRPTVPTSDAALAPRFTRTGIDQA